MTREEIRRCITSSRISKFNKDVLTFCKEPRSYKEMSNAWSDRKTLFDALVELKKAGGLLVNAGKYYSTEEALNELSSSE